mmetsp:Transcript_29000/g.78001  ORF Transcript_29000/g.78001 Transcript_29000/m.78001 type:complete len:275 (+) Transcript_29000:119-943(+)|eukprot:CAMPEP_0185186836 /NCGR_PEP_ID=MMETSP1140-20130426/4323_1 /TAXON_ID=298111 /ORGANISM="Pavlova sp., Strain CCMP459" /LENGTH=274 /DNA_ID=CAMNT_0027753161 /DNA_START=46 /DNA_END=870 /DNA_ORIENTATION=+
MTLGSTDLDGLSLSAPASDSSGNANPTLRALGELTLDSLGDTPVDAGLSDDVGEDKHLQLKQLLDPLDKDKLKAILMQLASDDLGVVERCIALAAGDVANRKVFVRGLKWTTSDEGLLNVFKTFGEIEEGGIARDRGTGKSRGFGFVTFKTASSAQAAIRDPNKIIDGRQTVSNLASAGLQNRAPQQSQPKTVRTPHPTFYAMPGHALPFATADGRMPISPTYGQHPAMPDGYHTVGSPPAHFGAMYPPAAYLGMSHPQGGVLHTQQHSAAFHH